MGGSVGSLVKSVTKPVQQVVGSVAQAVGITPEQQQQQAQPVQTVATDSAQGTSSVSVQQGAPQAAAGAQGGETEVNVGTGRLNRNVAKARQNFRTPPSNTGTPGSSIRI